MNISKVKKALIVYMSRGRSTLNTIENVLGSLKVPYNTLNRNDLSIENVKGYDLIISVGGDGTFLRASHFIYNNTPLLGVNSDPKKKEGFFTRANKNNFRKFISKPLKLTKLLRLEAFIGNKKITPFILNEVFIGHYKPYQMSALEINSSILRCSGIIVSTPSGSYAWNLSGGGKIISQKESKFQYLALDTYNGRIYKNKDKNRILSRNQEVVITPKLNGCIIVIDSLSVEFHIKKNQKLRVRVSDKPLTVVDG